MPELPEVELLRLGLTRYTVGLTVADVAVRNTKVFSGDRRRLLGGKVEGVRRFGKMLSIDLSNGYSLAVHVKMTGRLIYRGKNQPRSVHADPDLMALPGKHTHVIFTFQNGDHLYYNDVRRFGWIRIVPRSGIEEIPFVKKLGPEPFRDLTREHFSKILSGYARPIKTLLMDQERISGVGNIYANEALFCAGIAPSRKSNSISKRRQTRLYDCILKVLEASMKYGGSSTDAFRDVLGQKGQYQDHYLVYNREGKACLREGCGGAVKKDTLGGRGTYFCSKCQKY